MQLYLFSLPLWFSYSDLYSIMFIQSPSSMQLYLFSRLLWFIYLDLDVFIPAPTIISVHQYYSIHRKGIINQWIIFIYLLSFSRKNHLKPLNSALTVSRDHYKIIYDNDRWMRQVIKQITRVRIILLTIKLTKVSGVILSINLPWYIWETQIYNMFFL